MLMRLLDVVCTCPYTKRLYLIESVRAKMKSLSSTPQTHTSSDASSKDRMTPRSLREKYTFIREIGHRTQGRIYLAERNVENFV